MKTIEVEAKFLTMLASQLEGQLGIEDYYYDKLTIIRDKVRAFNPTNNNKQTTVRLSNIQDAWIVNMPYDEFKYYFEHPILFKLRNKWRKIFLAWYLSGGKEEKFSDRTLGRL